MPAPPACAAVAEPPALPSALMGCNARVDLRGGDRRHSNNLVSSCTALCPPVGTDDDYAADNDDDASGGHTIAIVGAGNGKCSGIGCCQANILQKKNLQSYDIQYIVYITDETLNFTEEAKRSLAATPLRRALPATLDWMIRSNSSCSTPANSSTSTTTAAPPAGAECRSEHSVCEDYYGGGNDILGYSCLCSEGYRGNPYVAGGCHGLTIGLGVSGGISILIMKIELHKVKKMKQRFLKQNHGLLLQQLISQNVNIGERIILNLRELEKATDNFDKTREVGGGGHGIIYKGILDLHVVAIKKSRIVVQREIDDFINEVAILSQVNHRNVIKLLGCYLETEVPMLVYEFISNGSLDDHLHIDGPISLLWVDRIRIALEVSRTLVYLHSATTTPIFHRDIKASNILHDDNLTAKIADFGASRYIHFDQTGVTTAVQGTIGSLDLIRV
uniref:Protein kinase domain-containing protein n=1 Tax=Oryza punctata TaxID=4537 RepID=A0A0E0MMB9_ORYPU